MEQSVKLSGAVVPVAEVIQYLRNDHFMTRAEACQYLKCSKRKLDSCKSLIRFRIPKSKRILFRKSDLDSLLEPIYPIEKKQEALSEIETDRRPELDALVNNIRLKFLAKGRKK